MGVEGAVGFIKREGSRFGLQNQPLKSGAKSYIVVDATKSMDKLVRGLLKSRGQDLFDELGCSSQVLAELFRDLIKRLVVFNQTPIFVFPGGRKSQVKHNAMVSGEKYLRGTCSIALHDAMSRKSRNFDLPELATNLLKEVICNLKQQHLEIEVHQATYEVYPKLEELARQRQCSVLSGHSDFVLLANVPAGFYFFDDLEMPSDPQAPLRATLYQHSRLLETYKMREEQSSALKTFATLLRNDFHSRYYNCLNGLFKFGDEFKMSSNFRDRKMTRRLIWIMDNARQNPNLQSYETVLQFVRSFGDAVVSDFEQIHETYANHEVDFRHTEFGELLNSGDQANGDVPNASRVSAEELHETLTQRESSAEFLFHLGDNTQHYRTRPEDFDLTRSSFSLQDAGRQFLLDNSVPRRQKRQLRLFDRRLTQMQDRILLQRTATESGPPSGESLLKVFHTSTEELERLARLLTSQREVPNGEHLALMMLLARYALRLIPRPDYSNSPPPEGTSAAQNNRSGPVGLRASERGEIESLQMTYQKLRLPLQVALMNSFVYLSRNLQGDQTDQSTPADIRVARRRVGAVLSAAPQTLGPAYTRRKHLIESVNSVFHIYKELNALFNYPAPRLYAAQHYDGAMIHKLLAAGSKNLQGHLLSLSEEMERHLDGSPAT